MTCHDGSPLATGWFTAVPPTFSLPVPHFANGPTFVVDSRRPSGDDQRRFSPENTGLCDEIGNSGKSGDPRPRAGHADAARRRGGRRRAAGGHGRSRGEGPDFRGPAVPGLRAHGVGRDGLPPRLPGRRTGTRRDPRLLRPAGAAPPPDRGIRRAREAAGDGRCGGGGEEFAAGDPFVVLNSDNYYPAEALAGIAPADGPAVAVSIARACSAAATSRRSGCGSSPWPWSNNRASSRDPGKARRGRFGGPAAADSTEHELLAIRPGDLRGLPRHRAFPPGRVGTSRCRAIHDGRARPTIPR